MAEAAVQEKSDRASGLLLTLGNHLRMVADFPGAKAAVERALEILEKVYGSDHPNAEIVRRNLSSLD